MVKAVTLHQKNNRVDSTPALHSAVTGLNLVPEIPNPEAGFSRFSSFLPGKCLDGS
jgi:hypothetical protein